MQRVMQRRYANFDYLRLFLALSVICLHGWHSKGIRYGALPFMVPVFLGISGFVIPPSLESSQSIVHFFWKRFLRVTPGFIAALVIVGFGYGFQYIGPTLTSWYSFGFIRGEGKDPVLWSLACEEVIYICIAALYVAGLYKKPSFLWSSLVVTTILEAYIMPQVTILGTNPAMLPSAFLIGNLLYVYREKLLTHPSIPLIASVVLFAYLPFRPDDYTIQYLHQSLLVAALVWLGFAGPQMKWRLPLDISYGVYIYHWMIVLPVAAAMQNLYGIIIVTSLLTIVVSIVSALIIERPALRFKDWIWWKRSNHRSIEVEPAA